MYVDFLFSAMLLQVVLSKKLSNQKQSLWISSKSSEKEYLITKMHLES